MYIGISFFHFEVRIASGDCHIVIFARIRINNLPVHLGYKGTSNRSRGNLQLLKSDKDANGREKLVSWLKGTCGFWCVKTLLDWHLEIKLSENAMQS